MIKRTVHTPPGHPLLFSLILVAVKIATQGLEPVAVTSAALELDEEEDEKENSGTATTTPTSTSNTRGPSIPQPSPPNSWAAKKAKTDGFDMAEELSRRADSFCKQLTINYILSYDTYNYCQDNTQ